jgi:membrane-associated protein
MSLDLTHWLTVAGYPGMAAIIFAETGLLIGFFLPGDSLLLSAGFLAQRGQFSIWVLLGLLIAAAIAGDATGYAIGWQAGPRLFHRDDGRFFRRSHLARAQKFYERHGGKTILIARFVGFVRTAAPTIAGAAGMGYGRFATFNVLGAACWVGLLLTAGFVLGGQVDSLETYFSVLFGSAVLLSLAPAAWQVVRRRRAVRGLPEFARAVRNLDLGG